jgi:hypothetical protein
MVRRLALYAAVLALVGYLVFPRACSDVEKRSIIVETGRISVINVSDTPWSDVEVWLNDQYRMQARELAPGQRLVMSTRGFVAGFGQLFDPKKQSPYGIEVTAKGADGKPVRLTWGQGRRR